MFNGQIFGHKFGFEAGGVKIGPYTLAFDAVVTGRGGTLTTAEKTYLSTFETNLGADITEFDRMFILGLNNNIAARTSFVNPSTAIATAVNNPTFTPNVGYNGDGVTSYINSNYNPRIDGVKYTLNNAQGSLYANNLGSYARFGFGAFDFNFLSSSIYPFYNPTQALYYINNTGPDTYITANPLKLHSAVRPNSSNMQYFQNGIKIDDRANTSTNSANLNIFILGLNLFGSPFSLYDGRLSFVSFGSSNINQVNFYNSVQTLGTSIGWAV